MISGHFLAFGHPTAGIVLVMVLTLALSHSIAVAILGALLFMLLYGGALVVGRTGTSRWSASGGRSSTRWRQRHLSTWR